MPLLLSMLCRRVAGFPKLDDLVRYRLPDVIVAVSDPQQYVGWPERGVYAQGLGSCASARMDVLECLFEA